MTQASITTHVLDTSRGKPAAGVAIALEREAAGALSRLGGGVTDADGRLRTLLEGHALEAGTYRLTFDTGAYYAARGEQTFYPSVSIVFVVTDASQHHHVPLLLSPHGFTTYRGS